MHRAGREQLLAAHARDLLRLATALVGDGAQAAATVAAVRARLAGPSWGRRRSPEELLAAARAGVLRGARRARSPWARTDPLAPAAVAQREVLALRATTPLSLPAVAHLLDLPVGAAAAREAAGLQAVRAADLDALRDALEPWLDAETAVPLPPPAPAGSTLRPLAGLVAVAVLAGGGALLVDVAPAPDRTVAPARISLPEPEPLPARPEPSASGCAAPGGDALCAEPTPPPALPAAEGVDPRRGTPFWPFTTDRQAADWAADRSRAPWAGDAVQVAQHLVDDLLRLPGLRAGAAAGGSVGLVRDGREVATVRLVRLGRGTTRPWSVVGVESAGVAHGAPGPLAPGASPAGRAPAPVDVRLLDPDGRLLARAAALGQPLSWSRDWTVGALVAVRRDGAGLALRPVRREGSVDDGVPAPGSTFVSLVNGSVRLHDALSGEIVLQVSTPSAGARDSDPSRGGRDAVVFVRTEADGCTTSVLRAALDRGAGGTTVQRAPLVRRLPRLSPSARWLGWVEAPCAGGPGTLLLRGPDARVRRLDLGGRAVSRLDVRDDGSAVLQLRGPDRVVDLPAGATSLVPALPVPAGCAGTAASASGGAVLVWERCGATATPVLHDRGSRRPLGRPGPPVLESAVVQAPDGPLVLARTSAGAVVRLVRGRLVEALTPCLRAPGCVTTVDW